MKRLEALRALKEAVEAGADGIDVLEALHPAEQMLGHAGRYVYAIDAYHGSLDAARALHEAVLPEWTFVIGPAAVHLWRNEDYGDPFCAPHEGKADCPARAWLLAIIAALIAQDEGK